MERRILLAFVLAFLVLYAFQAIFPPPQPASPAPAEAPAAAAPVAAAAAPPADPTSVVPPPQDAAALVSETEERRIVVETDTVRAVFTNRGGVLESWALKAYSDDNGEPIDLVPTNVPAGAARPFSLVVENDAITSRLQGALYRVTGDTGGRIDATAGDATLVFEYEDESGLRVRKTFEFRPDNYVVTFSAAVAQGETVFNPTVVWGPGLSDHGAASASGSSIFAGYVQAPQAIYRMDGSCGAWSRIRNACVSRLGVGALETQPAYEGEFRFAGIDDHYFMSATVEPGVARVDYEPVALSEGPDPRWMVSYSVRYAASPDEEPFFIGPKQFDTLQAVEPELVRAIHFGIFGFLAAPLLSALNWIYGYVGNYGWAIVILTVLINLSMFYFRHKSVVSMRKMQEIQPQVRAIQDRYKDLSFTDPARQKMNQEVMALYREKGVNPASGCLPMVMMMPVLIAFYSFLSVAIELRGAEFGWWIHDLSRPDPYFIVPILMGATMLWQQRITPTTVDPVQQRVMLIMPVMFTFMFLWFPSGLVIYWFTSNLWAIGQQYFTTWLIGPPPAAAPRPAAERKLKPAGSGRSAGAEKKTAEKRT